MFLGIGRGLLVVTIHAFPRYMCHVTLIRDAWGLLGAVPVQFANNPSRCVEINAIQRPCADD